jgi:hypothetical protein
VWGEAATFDATASIIERHVQSNHRRLPPFANG